MRGMHLKGEIAQLSLSDLTLPNSYWPLHTGISGGEGGCPVHGA